MRSRDLEPSPGHTAPRTPLACILSARRLTHWPSRLMTPRPSRLHLGPGRPTLDHNAAHAAPLCQLWTCQTRAPKSHAHGVRHGAWSRRPRVPTRLRLHNEHGAGDLGTTRHHPACSSQRLRHLKLLERGHPTRRASAGGEGPPQTTPLLWTQVPCFSRPVFLVYM
jgi:hypothetical protein